MKPSIIVLSALFLVFQMAACSKNNPDSPDAGPFGPTNPDGSVRNSHTALEVPGLSGVSAASAGKTHSCAVADGAVSCWGGSLGAKPVAVKGLESRVTHLVSGDNSNCAVRDGSVLCWGGRYGAEPKVLSLGNVKSLSAFEGKACAVSDDRVYCWNETDQKPAPVQAVPQPAQLVSVGAKHTCSLAKGGVYCWGENDKKQLGIDSDSQDPSELEAVNELPLFPSAYRQLVSGANHTCLLQKSERDISWTFCWGSNDRGQLAVGAPSEPKLASDTGNHELTAASAGGAHTCAVSTNGTFCAGDNAASQLGVGKSGNETKSVGTLTAVTGLPGPASSIAGGASHTCAVSNGKVFCWGDNEKNQLGR